MVRMNRRCLMLAPLALPLPFRHAGATPAGSPPGPAAQRRLRLRHAATGARFAGPYHDGRAHDPDAMAELSRVLADSRTGAVHAFDPAAIDILWDVARRCRMDEELVILSGFRTQATNRAVHGAGDSQHLRAGAVDVQLAAARLAGFGETALGLARGGVGVYRRRGFVHLDSGPVRHWADTGTTAGTDRIGRIAAAWAAASGR